MKTPRAKYSCGLHRGAACRAQEAKGHAQLYGKRSRHFRCNVEGARG